MSRLSLLNQISSGGTPSTTMLCFFSLRLAVTLKYGCCGATC
jgi:hypothetical protein